MLKLSGGPATLSPRERGDAAIAKSVEGRETELLFLFYSTFPETLTPYFSSPLVSSPISITS